jgi:hypothetical protein
MIKVILLIDCADEHDRKLLRGMMRYSKEHGPWLFQRLSPNYRFGGGREEQALQLARDWDADAIIGRWDDNKIHLLDDIGIPVILQNNRRRSDVFSKRHVTRTLSPRMTLRNEPPSEGADETVFSRSTQYLRNIFVTMAYKTVNTGIRITNMRNKVEIPERTL